MHIVKLRERGGNLVITIPRSLWRELGWTVRELVGLDRTEQRGIIVTRLEAHLDGIKRLRAHPVGPDPRTSSPTAREHRP